VGMFDGNQVVIKKLALIHTTMSASNYRLSHVSCVGVPAKILNCIIRDVIIIMATSRFPFWSRADESLKHQSVNQSVIILRVFTKGGLIVAILIKTRFKYFTLSVSD